MQVHTGERLRSLFLQDVSAKPVLLLGAGASLKSGVPLSDQIVELAAKWAYCQSSGQHPDDPAVKRSDWLQWVQRHRWYRSEVAAYENYSAVIQNTLQPRHNRREFFLKLIRPGVPASSGYEHLFQLLDQGRIDTILTTNFDSVIPDLRATRRRPHHIEVIQTPADYIKFSTSPGYPQLVYLHGSVEHYTDKNLVEDLQRLDDSLVALLSPVLRDHPLIVVGYRGGEASIMQHLLGDEAPRTNNFRRGIFWCQMFDAPVHPAVAALHEKLAGNLQLVSIAGFDEVMASIAAGCASLPALVSTWRPHTSDDARVPFDMRVAKTATADDLDWARVQVQITAYCRKMQIDIPSKISRDWLEQRMEQLDLLRRDGEALRPTNAGYLLFAAAPGVRIPAARCLVRVRDERERVVEGNLWSQLEVASDLLAELNRPFRLKASVSESVFPYPPLALKELLVNALVHRSYEGSEPLVIEVDDTFVRFVNPGGLVGNVFERVNTHLQQQIEFGARGIRGYRNTVIADLFYGAGAMDKEGSGLPDVHAQVKQNGGRVFFGPVDETNVAFRALVYRRPEEADRITHTAPVSGATSKFFANLLEVVSLPPLVYSLPTELLAAKEVFDRCGTELPPVFVLKRGTELYSFSNLGDSSNPLQLALGGHSAPLNTETRHFIATPEGHRTVVELLNRAFVRHLETKGLTVDFRRKRAYFPRTKDGAREITYQASLRQATRTVTKPVTSQRTGTLLYWQHEALSFAFDRFGDEWALRILPGYAFTKDGEREELEHTKIGPLATRKAARDFTLQVHNHLVFWTWVLAGGADGFPLDVGAVAVQVRGLLLSCELSTPLTADVEPGEEFVRDQAMQVERLEKQIEADLESDTPEAVDED